MKYAVSTTDTTLTEKIEKSGLVLLEKLKEYERALQEITILEKPRGIVFHDLASATELYSTIPLPAYTSRDLIHITPTLETWKEIYSSSAGNVKEAIAYYESLDMDDIAELAAHELTHHADFFHDDFEEVDEENMWFEEGLCFYLPRKLIFSEEKYKAIMSVESKLIDHYKMEYGEYSITDFGEAGYRGGNRTEYAAAFYDYWRSTKVVRILVENYFNNDVNHLIECYGRWDISIPLHSYFVQELELGDQEAKEMWLY